LAKPSEEAAASDDAKQGKHVKDVDACAIRAQNMWTLGTATLAPDSRRVVASCASGTKSRAADLELLESSLVGVRVGRTSVAQTSRWILSALLPQDNRGAWRMSWTDERVEMLKKLWADGLSASHVAAELGGITRNAVIGKVHRLGLAGRAKSPTSTGSRPRKPRSQILRVSRPVMRGNTALAEVYEYETDAEPGIADNVIPITQRRSLLELTAQTCRWPIGDPGNPDFFFCGGRTAGDSPYCAHHSRIAYQPSHLRRDRRPLARG
jgi:GcrA cell cycle regulator